MTLTRIWNERLNLLSCNRINYMTKKTDNQKKLIITIFALAFYCTIYALAFFISDELTEETIRVIWLFLWMIEWIWVSYFITK